MLFGSHYTYIKLVEMLTEVLESHPPISIVRELILQLALEAFPLLPRRPVRIREPPSPFDTGAPGIPETEQPQTFDVTHLLDGISVVRQDATGWAQIGL